MNKCWICRRTEDEFKNDFLNEVLNDKSISEDIKEGAKRGECVPNGLIQGKLYLPIIVDDANKNMVGVNVCPVCEGLLHVRTRAAIDVIEHNHSALFEWFQRFSNQIK